MDMESSNSRSTLHAQPIYLPEDPEFAELIWQIAALPPDARLIVRLMVAHLAVGNRA